MANAPAMGGGSVQLRLNAGPQLALIRDLNGRFNRIQTPMRDAAGDMAYMVAREMRDYLEETMKRRKTYPFGDRSPALPGRETAYLRNALVDERNMRFAAGRIEVGLRDWLDQSLAAPYWENLDKGTKVHVGRTIRFWNGKGGPLGPRTYRGMTLAEGEMRVRGGTLFTRIDRPIRAVNFLRTGANRGARRIEGGYAQQMYEKYLSDYPIRFAARMGRAPGGGFTAP